MDIGAIKARIAELEQRKAERNALRGYRDLSYLDYMVNGDRSGFDKIEADDVAYRNMLKQQAQQERLLRLQQEFNARENELNRINAKEIASQNRTSSGGADETAKLMREVEYAQAEYEAAKDMVDMNNPQSIANYKKAASKYNYWIKQLPKEFEGYEPYTMEVTEDAPSVKLNKNKKWLDAHKGYEKLTDAEQEEYDRRVSELPVEEQEQYKVNKAKKGSTVETAEKNELRQLIKYKNAGLLDSKQRNRLSVLSKKYPGVK